MARISACMIVKNEAANLPRCLQSVAGVADEIIVVDTGSTDETISIAQRLGAQVFHFQWSNDFAAARNCALDQAKGDWIIFLDADEYIRADKTNNVRPFIENIHGNRSIESILCRLENTEGVDGPMRSSNPTLRIFRNSPAIRYEGIVHEWVYKRGKDTKALFDASEDIVIRHTGYTKKTISEKVMRNLALLEKALEKDQVRALTYFYLSDSYWRLQSYDKAIEFAHKALDHGGVNRTIFAYKPYIILLDSMVSLGTYSKDALDAILVAGGQKYPLHPEILLSQAIYYRRTGNCDQALQLFLQSLEAHRDYCYPALNNDYYTSLLQVYREIAVIYDKRNEDTLAMEYFVQALRQDKYDIEAFKGLMSLIRTQEPSEVASLVNALYDITAEEDVGFLVMQLSRIKIRKVFDYYQKIWSERFRHPEYSGMVLLLNQRFDLAFPLFAASFRETGEYDAELAAVIAMLLGGVADWVDSLGPKLSPALQKIIAASFSADTGRSLEPEVLPVYLELLSNFAWLCPDERLDRLLQLARQFTSDSAVAQIGHVLLAQRLFRPALNMYVEQLGWSSSGLAGDNQYLAGLCCYKLQDYASAVSYFTQAIAAGYRNNEISEYLAWSYRHCPAVSFPQNQSLAKSPEIYAIQPT
ncbi:MAG: glycosyltransferase [Negativicutes bacterium]|nr:glycosyltransferase [Negativicutes bacterium]